MNTKNNKKAESSNDFYTLLASSLNHLKEVGYHRRGSGATFLSDKKVKCDCCGRPTQIKIGYEKDYPKNVDIGLCSACADELDDLYGS